MGGSTDKGSSSSVRGSLSRCPAGMPLLVVEQELAGHPEDSLPNLWAITTAISAAFI